MFYNIKSSETERLCLVRYVPGCHATIPSDHSFWNILTKVPICGRISTWNSSPASSLSLGVLPIPTPAGVPVIMTVPAGRVVPCERKAMSWGIPKIRSLQPDISLRDLFNQ